MYSEDSVKFEKVAVWGNGASEGVRGKGQWVVLCCLWCGIPHSPGNVGDVPPQSWRDPEADKAH